MTKILIIAACMKDIVKYAGGCAARFAAAGNKIHSVVIHESKSEESEEVRAVLGIASCTYLNLEEPLKLDSESTDKLASIYRKLRPDRILTYSRQNNPEYPSHGVIRDFAMCAYQTASGAGFRDGNDVSPRQTPFIGFVIKNENTDLYISIDQAIEAKCKAAGILRLNRDGIKARAYVNAEKCKELSDTQYVYAEGFTLFGGIAKTGKFIW